MLLYILIFVITAVLALVTFETKKVSPVLFYGYVLALGVFVGISDMLGGYDRYIYCEVFTTNADEVAAGHGIRNEIFRLYLDKEPIYGLINTLIGLYTPNRYIFIFVYTLLLYLVYAICFYKYTTNPFFALVCFLGMMFFFTFTYLRQVLAAGVIWLALPYYTKRSTWRFFLMVAVATMIHNSAAIMGVLYFVPIRKWSWKVIAPVMTVLLVLGLIGVGGLFTFAGNITGSENVSSHASAAETGFRYEYVLESFVFLTLLYLNYNSVREDKESLSYTNLYLMFCGTLLFFCKSGDGGRLAWYGVMGIIIMLTYFCHLKRGLQLRYFLILMYFTLFMRIIIAWGVLLSPYKTFFTDGVRKDDFIYELYEYDENYKIDKFYNL